MSRWRREAGETTAMRIRRGPCWSSRSPNPACLSTGRAVLYGVIDEHLETFLETARWDRESPR